MTHSASLEPALPDSVNAKADLVFRTIVGRLRTVLPSSAEIEHVGGLSLRNLVTRHRLDIVVRVAPEQFGTAKTALANVLECATGLGGSHGFAIFREHDTDPSVGLQLVVRDSADDIFVRLHADARLVDRYLVLKREFGKPPVSA